MEVSGASCRRIALDERHRDGGCGECRCACHRQLGPVRRDDGCLTRGSGTAARGSAASPSISIASASSGQVPSSPPRPWRLRPRRSALPNSRPLPRSPAAHRTRAGGGGSSTPSRRSTRRPRWRLMRARRASRRLRARPPQARASANFVFDGAISDPAGGSGRVFDAASWSGVARADASWNTASWNSASWRRLVEYSIVGRCLLVGRVLGVGLVVRHVGRTSWADASWADNASTDTGPSGGYRMSVSDLVSLGLAPKSHVRKAGSP
jgi:hypothetical protein